jgi:voltage-gated potassium channel
MNDKKEDIRKKIGNIIFEHSFFSAKLFDIILLILILISTITIIVETVPSIKEKYGQILLIIEWTIIVLFTIEYILRIYSAKDRKKYVSSLYGIIDLISIVPAYISLLFPPIYYLSLFRAFRIFRIFRILKLLVFLKEETVLIKSLKKSIPKIIVFLSFIIITSSIFASIMYVVEGPENGFTDIPTSMYWTIVTLTTVGYGDITPLTPIGKILASIIMICGYGIIAVPTGIVVSEYSQESFKEKSKIKRKIRKK